MQTLSVTIQMRATEHYFPVVLFIRLCNVVVVAFVSPDANLKGDHSNESLRWLNTVLRAVSGNSRGGVCFKLDKQTWRRKKQLYREDDFSKSTH